jgi:hypothetical protein
MNVILCEWARLGLALIKKRNAPMSVSIYFRSLAARCRTSARDCIDLFAKEEFRKLANEFETRADQLERTVQPAALTDRWLTQREQARGFTPMDSRRHIVAPFRASAGMLRVN